MTLRAVITGFFCAAFLCGFCFFNDHIIRQSYLVRSYLPLSVFGGLLLFVICVNPLLGRIHRRLPFSGRELAVVVAMVLVACGFPEFTCAQILPCVLMLPHYFVRTDPGWLASGVLDLVPKRMLADPTVHNGESLIGFARGMGTGVAHVRIGDITWSAWTQTLGFWLPVIAVLSIGALALSVIIHRQWARHEHLPYPVAAFVQAILPDAHGRWSAVMRNRWYWIALAAVLLVHLNNWGCQWFPNYLVPIPLNIDSWSISSLFPRYARSATSGLLAPPFFFSIVAFAFLLPTGTSFSIGIVPYLYAGVVTIFLMFDVHLGGAYMSQEFENYMHAGAFLSMFLVLLYTGRHYYGTVVRRAFLLPAREEAGVAETWAARLFALSFAALSIMLTGVGLDWPLVVFNLVCIFVLLTVMSRLVAEAGVVYVYSAIFPCALTVGFFGPWTLGVKSFLLLAIVTSVLVVETTHTLMPFAVTANKLLDVGHARIGRSALIAAGVVLVALAVSVPVTLYWQYDRGALNAGHEWNIHAAPKYAYNETVTMRTKLEAQGVLDTAGSVHGWRLLTHMRPDGARMAAFAIMFMLTAGCAFARFRWSWWPFHPAMFLIVGTGQSLVLAFSFLVGWAIKLIASKYGGQRACQELKPFMFGLVSGEMLAGVLLTIHGVCYYFATGMPPKLYNIFGDW